nr:DNA-directed DNA polymerase [Tanacetum cinerariifolium]
MRTKNSYFLNNSSVTIPTRRNKRRAPNIVELELRTIVEVAPMVDNRTMEELLQAPTERYEEAIVRPEINADHFEIKTNCYNWMNTTSRENSSKTNDRIDKLTDQMLTLVDIVSKKVVTPATVKAVEESCVTCGGNHAHYNCDTTNSNQSSVCAATGTYNQVVPQNRASNHMAPPSFALGSFSKQEENLTKKLNDDMRSILGSFFQNQASTSGTNLSNTIPNPKGEMKAITTRSGVTYEGPLISTNPSPKKTLPKPNIPYPLRLNDQKLCEKATNQMEKFFQIFQDLHFDISFADALLLMPELASTIESLLANKDKLFELDKIPLNENCSAMLRKKHPEKLGDPGKFLIPCDFLGMDVCHTLADLGASINLLPLSIWKKLSLPELTPTRMTLELANRSITRPKGVAEDVFVKVGKFHFPTDFVVVDFEVDPRVPLILGRSFLRIGRALIDVYGEEITLRVNDEAVTFNLNQTTRYSSTYDDMSVAIPPRILSLLFMTLLLPPLRLREVASFLEENEAYLKDESISPEQGEVAKEKSSIKEPLELELKDLPSHLEYAYLEGADNLHVIIGKDLKDDEKEAFLKVLKSHKRAIAWKITDIKGIDPRFCTHNILMEEDYKPSVQSQRRVNQKIHEVIKKEVIKLLDAGMIYPIFDSPWVSPIHCVPKKGGITVVENENNELILHVWLRVGAFGLIIES